MIFVVVIFVKFLTLMSKYSANLRLGLQMDVRFFGERYCCTSFVGQCSSVAETKAIVIQESAIGPAFYVPTAADLRALTAGNRVFKYAGDTFLGVLLAALEVKHIEAWAATNNLKLYRC